MAISAFRLHEAITSLGSSVDVLASSNVSFDADALHYLTAWLVRELDDPFKTSLLNHWREHGQGACKLLVEIAHSNDRRGPITKDDIKLWLKRQNKDSDPVVGVYVGAK